jgi:hypothetical protein
MGDLSAMAVARVHMGRAAKSSGAVGSVVEMHWTTTLSFEPLGPMHHVREEERRCGEAQSRGKRAEGGMVWCGVGAHCC